MLKIGLTGNHYSGQYEVSHLFEDLDVPIFDVNLITKFIVNYSPQHVQKIKGHFGDGIYDMGVLDLKKFNSNKDMDKLISLIELDLLKAYEKFRLKHSDSFYTIFKFDFIFERLLEKHLDFTVCCYRPKFNRKSDMKYLTNYSFYLIDKILDNEMDEIKKNSKADFIVQNYNKNGDYKSDIVIGLESQVQNIHRQIMKKKNSSILSNHYSLDVDRIQWD
jgi:dephospho-CoA kinase